jgi:hypothetical protein
MKKTALALAILLATGAANAIGFGNDNPSSSNDNRNTNTNTNAPSQDQGQAQGQLQGQAQGQLQGQAQATSVNVHASPRSSSMSGAAAFSGGNTQAVTVTDSGRMRYSGSYSVKSTGIAPDIIANPTAPCRIATSVSGAGVGFGFGFGGSVLDDGCDTRADATMLLAAGEPDAAIARLCQKAEMAKALGGRCGAPVTGPSAPAISSTPATYGAGFKH